MNSKVIRQQKKSFRNIVNKNRQSLLSEYLGISSLDTTARFPEVFSKYCDLVDICNHEQLTELLKKVSKTSDLEDADLFNYPNLLNKEQFNNFAYTRRGYLRPLDKVSIKQLDVIEDYIKYACKELKIGFSNKDKIFYMFDNASIKYHKGSDIADMRALQLNNYPWYRGNKPLPILKDLMPAGQSHIQCLHAMLDQLEKFGKEITVFVASSKQVVELSLLYSQRRGEFASFKSLLPNLKLWVNDTGFNTSNQSLISSVFSGLNIKKVDIYNSVTGALAIQEDVNKPGVLTLQTDLDVFYEFVPIEYVNNRGYISTGAKRYHVGSVEVNKEYLLLVSNKSGLLSVTTSDVVKVVSLNPLKIVYTRRAQALNEVKENINTNLIDRIIASLNKTLESYHILIRDYLVGFDNLEKKHIWALEINKSPELVDDKILASIVNRIHKMLYQYSNTYHRAIDSGDLSPPRIYILPLGGLSVFEMPKGVYGLDLSEDARLVNKFVENNTYKALQAANVRVL